MRPLRYLIAIAAALLAVIVPAATAQDGAGPVGEAWTEAGGPHPDEVADRKRIVAVINDFRPYGYRDHEGEAVGLGVDILNVIARRANLEVSYIARRSVSDALDAIRKGEAAVHPTLADLPERRELLAFSEPYDVLRIRVYRSVDSEIVSSETPYGGLRLGFNKGSIADFATRSLEGVTPVPLPSNDDVLLALAEGEIDGAVYPQKAFERLLRAFELEDKYHAVGEPLREIQLRIAVDRDMPALLALIDQTIQDLNAKPAWQAMRHRWFPPPLPYWNRKRILIAAGIIVGLTILAATVLMLRERERARNRLLRESQERVEVERALMEQQAAANRLLIRHNREMQNILYVVSHDLKSPLVSIGGFARKAERETKRGESEAALSALNRVRSNVETMGRLIEGILQLNRIGRERLAPTPINWQKLIERLNGALAVALEEKHATIEVEGPLPEVTADPTQFYQLVQNLVSNALNHGCPSPGMTVRISGRTEADWHWIAVSDDGPGIPPEFHDRIFGLFQRLDRTKDGSGIGLATVLNIAERHGGSARVASQPGKGATFWIGLPISLTSHLVARAELKAQTRTEEDAGAIAGKAA